MQDKQEEKIQLHELASYLAYGLKVKHKLSPTIHELIGIHYEQFQQGIHCLQLKSKKMLTPMSAMNPLVRPLSELFNDRTNPMLSKVIEGDGWSYLYLNVYKKKEAFNINAIHYDCIQELLKHHFDVYNWLDRGLAINPNTIK